MNKTRAPPMTKDDEATEDAARLDSAQRQLEQLFSIHGGFASLPKSVERQSTELSRPSDEELEAELDELETELDYLLR